MVRQILLYGVLSPVPDRPGNNSIGLKSDQILDAPDVGTVPILRIFKPWGPEK